LRWQGRAELINRHGAPRTLALGTGVVAAGWLMRVTVTDSLWQIIVGTTVVGIGTGIGYAAIPTLINTHTPLTEIAAANGLNTLFRILGSSLATGLRRRHPRCKHCDLGDVAIPSLDAYRTPCSRCAGASILAAVIVLLVAHPKPATAGA
jgi:MFS family permease